MECPKCHFDHPLQTAECLRCGIVFSKYQATPASAPVDPPIHNEEHLALWQKANHELICRAFALPAALLVGWLIVHAMPMLADMLRMWTHETGHGLTAWLCGYPALPTAWITIHSSDRVPVAGFLLAAALAFGGYVAFRMERWFWLGASAIALLLLLAGNLRSAPRAELLIIFGGDAGSFVVASALMATFYARPASAVRRKQLRWA